MPDLPVASARPASVRLLADQAFSRAAGAPLVGGNAVRVLRNAAEHFPAWHDAIRAATRSILFESYIIEHDAVGASFRDALVEKARSGVRVRVLYDWLGSPGKLGRGFWKPLAAAGGEVRAFNPPRFDSPLGWLSRDHRKSIVVDGALGYVTGLCVSAAWLGDPLRGREPWRDTGVEIRGPAVADVERAFAQVWSIAGPPIPDAERTEAASIAPAGATAVRVIADAPSAAGLFRVDQLIAALARSRLWLTDAYFVPMAPYVEALRSAARDGVDVRVLVPGASDIAILSPLSRSGYRSLLEAGVRVFEWNGTMLHAKTAVADGRWARVGSTNLNVASLISNYELDVAIEDERVAQRLEECYADDLEHATEIVLLRKRRHVAATPVAPEREPAVRRAMAGSAGRAAAGALRLGGAVGEALTQPRELATGEGRILVVAAAGLALFGVVAFRWPHVVSWPAAAIGAWFAAAFLLRAFRAWRQARRARLTASRSIPEGRADP